MAQNLGIAHEHILSLVREAATQRILYLPHAISQMNAPDRMISTIEVRSVVLRGAVIEDYPGDARGHSCLMLGQGDIGQSIHVVCAPKDGYLAIITAYLPNPAEWQPDFRTRKEKQP